ncbi:MAG TPA: UDP-N-acetylmuramate dehydrogenase [Desulfotomaculum sp.]|nr:UDP-N-acetylmuramate dehydrogenase [Desulfotomaculum sp.]
MQLPESVASRIKGRILYGEPLKNYTTWRIGGPAEVLVEPASREDVAAILAFVQEKGLPVTVIGNGSNLLVSDRGVKGVVVRIGEALGRVRIAEERIVAESGAKLGRVAAIAQAAGLAGLEFSVGIPATIGGAVTMNAGANGASMADVVEAVRIIDYTRGERILDREELDFRYRWSRLQELQAVGVEVVLKLTPGDPLEIKRRGERHLQKRRLTQPLEFPSAGSVFKNPPGDAAGRLIELAGAKGLRVGDAMVSERHANFIINLGNAGAQDVWRLIRRVQEMVWSKFGVGLDLEVKVLGEDFV